MSVSISISISISISDIENAFFNHAADAGVTFTQRPLIADGRLHRAHVEGDKSGSKNGAYILHPDGNPSGWYQHFNTGITGKWTLSGKYEPMTDAMRVEINLDRQIREAEQRKTHDDAAAKAWSIWAKSSPIDGRDQHPYLIKKRIQPHDARLYHKALVIPIYDESGQIVNLQFISEDGTKRFLTGGRKKHCFSVIGKFDTDNPILICEGFATGVSLHESTGHTVVVAMDAGNLEPVALVMRRLYQAAQIVIAGDNDENRTGQKAARVAAIAVGGKYLIPETVGHDWNDSINEGLFL